MLIGGTGIGSRLAVLPGRTFAVPTSEGVARGRLVELDGLRAVVVQRHAAGHRTPPHAVAYKAMALAAQALSVRGCFATAAVGSLRPEWAPGTMVACSDFIDLTGRRQTLYRSSVVHTDFTEPMSHKLRQLLLDAARDEGAAIQDGATYLCGDGPRYETPAEIRMMRTLGADVVGMTAGTEAVLFREAGVPYACLAIVTNLAAGMGQAELTHGEVVDAMRRSGEAAVAILVRAARGLGSIA